MQFRELLEQEREKLNAPVEEEEKSKYDKVYNAVADYFNVDPEDIDTLDSDAKENFYNYVDQCWDEDEDKVPDSCPVDIDLENEKVKE
jgi:hypothetical protein